MEISTDLSIIIPAYNEEKRIREVIYNYVNYFPESEIIIIIEGTDDTLQITKTIAEKYPNLSYHFFTRRLGKGGAIIEGFRQSSRKYIGFTDCDESVYPEEYNKLLPYLKQYDGVIASRKLKKSTITENHHILPSSSDLFPEYRREVIFLSSRPDKRACRIHCLKRTQQVSPLYQPPWEEFRKFSRTGLTAIFASQ